jgi:hypothetical protein
VARGVFTCEPNPTTEVLRREVEAAFGRDDSIFLDRLTISSGGTRIRHEGRARWRVYSPEGTSAVSQVARDDTCVTLMALPSDVVVGIELF